MDKPTPPKAKGIQPSTNPNIKKGSTKPMGS